MVVHWKIFYSNYYFFNGFLIFLFQVRKIDCCTLKRHTTVKCVMTVSMKTLIRLHRHLRLHSNTRNSRPQLLAPTNGNCNHIRNSTHSLDTVEYNCAFCARMLAKRRLLCRKTLMHLNFAMRNQAPRRKCALPDSPCKSLK